MTYGAFTQDFAPYQYGGRSRKPLPQIGFCIVALGLTTAVGVWALRAHTDAPAAQMAVVSPAQPSPMKTASAAPAPVHIASKASAPAAEGTSERRVEGMLDPELTSRFAAVVFARSVPLRAGRPSEPPVQVAVAPEPAKSEIVSEQPQVQPEPRVLPEPQALPAPQTAQITLPQDTSAPEVSPLVKEIPLPLPRPADLAPVKVAVAPMPAGRPQAQDSTPSVAPAAPGRPSFFEKLFGGSDRQGPALAYAAPEDSVIGNVLRDSGRPAPVDRYTAVYNITSHTVTLPDGTQLEAHSGLGAAKDNPRMVTQRMVGATPPNVYDLTVREAPFHGVRALRLTPTGGTTYGRAGLLAHTYMLRGRSGESNGCVVFRDYAAFLRAYDSGAIRRLAVVSGA